MSKADKNKDRATTALKERVNANRRKSLTADDVKWFIETFDKHAGALQILEGPPAMIIIRSEAPLTTKTKRSLHQVATAGLMLYNVQIPQKGRSA